MEMDAYLEREFAGHRAAFEATDSALRGELMRLIEVCAQAITAGAGRPGINGGQRVGGPDSGVCSLICPGQ